VAVNRVLGLMPNRRGVMNLRLGALKVSRKFDLADPEDGAGVRAVLHAMWRRYKADVDAGRLPIEKMRKRLGFWVRKYRVDITDLTPMGERVIEQLEPETTLSDNFDSYA